MQRCYAKLQPLCNPPNSPQCTKYKQAAVQDVKGGTCCIAEKNHIEEAVTGHLDRNPDINAVAESQTTHTENDKVSDQERDSEESDDEDDILENFQPVMVSLDIDALRMVAVRTRKGLLASSDAHEDLSCSIEEPPKAGSYNLVYVIQFSDGVKWVAKTPGKGLAFTELDTHQMTTDCQTMVYFKNSTSVPLPKIYKWETTCETVGAPYALMDCLEGKPLLTLWFDKAWSTEEKRLKTLTNIAEAISSLGTTRFDRIGAIQFAADGQPMGVGKYVYSNTTYEEDTPWGIAKAGGPHETLTDDLLDGLDSMECPTKRGRSGLEIIRHAIKSIPAFMLEPPAFFLSPTDFNYQNIFVDADGAVTGFIDWDCTRTAAPSLGFARYPSWITRDWDPGYYGYDEEDADPYEFSPDTLSRYRQHYAAAFESLRLATIDPRHNRLSHIIEAINLASTDSVAESGIVPKLLEYSGCDFTMKEYADAFMEDRTKEMDAVIRDRFGKMWHAEWEEEGVVE